MRREVERGASLVEFALILPLLCLFLFGIIQWGIAFDKKQSINSAAREGARTAAIPTKTVNDIDAVVQSSFQTVTNNGPVTTEVWLISNPAVKFTALQKPCEGAPGNTVVVRAIAQHTITIPFFGTVNKALEGEGEFRCERAV